MGKIKQNKGSKDAAAKPEKVKKIKPVKVEAEEEEADEAPSMIPIAREDDGQKNAGKKGNKKNKKDKAKKAKKGGVEKTKPKDPKVNLSKKLKNLKKTVLVDQAKEPQVIADAPEILATTDAITTAVIALRKATEEESKSKNKLFAKDFRYCLQICQMKIPKAPSRQVRLDLAHSLYDDTDEVCLFVRDKEKGKKADPEQTAQQYEQLFREKKINFINKVLPLAELKQNYGSFEMKRKLEQTYDVFLSDSIISSYVFGLVGKAFIDKRKTAIPVKLKNVDADKWKVQLQKALFKTVYKQVNKGPTIAIPVATHKLTVEQFVANVEAVLNQLKTEYPGGWLNIRNIYLKPMDNSKISLPLYVSKISPNQVPTPVVVGPKARHIIKMADKLEQESSKFTVSEKGVLEKKKPNVKEEKTEKVKKEKAIKKEVVVKEEDDNEVDSDNGELDELEGASDNDANSDNEQDEENDSDDDDEPSSVPQKRKIAPVVGAHQKKKQKNDSDKPAQNGFNKKQKKKGPVAPSPDAKKGGKANKKPFDKKNTNIIKKFKAKA